MAVRFAMCNEFCEGWDFPSACRLAADAGYEAIEIAPFTLAESVEEITSQQREMLRGSAQECGIEVAGLHWLLVKPDGLYINHPDDAIRARTVAYLKAEVDFCADLGGRIMVFGSPKQRNVLESETYEATWDRAVAAFKTVAAHAASRDVCVCIEALTAAETNFVAIASEARQLVEAVDHPGFQMMLDVKAMCGDVEPIPDIIRKSARYLKHVHANDPNKGGPGFGDVDFRPIAAALKEIDYDGFLSVEVFDFSPGPEKIAKESIRYLKEVFAQ